MDDDIPTARGREDPSDEPDSGEDVSDRLARLERTLRALQDRLDVLAPSPCPDADHARLHAEGKRCPACRREPPPPRAP